MQNKTEIIESALDVISGLSQATGILLEIVSSKSDLSLEDAENLNKVKLLLESCNRAFPSLQGPEELN